MKDWELLPANAQTVRTVESCIDYLQKNHPYPPNMQPDRKNFAVARLGYQAAVYQLEKFMCELTEEIEECNGEFNGQLEKCVDCDGAVECYERNNPS